MAEEPTAEDQARAAEESEAPAEEQAPEAEAPAEEKVQETEAPADEQPEEAEAPAPSEEDEGLDWKARRRLERSRRPAEALPRRSPQERQEERRQRRRDRAVLRRRQRQSRRARKGEPRIGTPPRERRPNPAKVRQGVVVSDRADKTITVRIDIARRHPSYEKIVRRSRILRAHDEGNEAGQGDLVRLVETRPISRSKRWRLLEVVEKAR
jgi:small subunit ribosomal protein S17